MGQLNIKEWLHRPLVEQGQWLRAKLDNMNDDGSLIVPDDEFDDWARGMLDEVVFPFPEGSKAEAITDGLITTMGMFDGMKYVRLAAARYVEPIVDFVFEFAPLAKLADKLP